MRVPAVVDRALEYARAGGMAVDPLDPRPGQDLRSGRIGILVRPGDVVTELFGHERQPGDRVAANADEVDPHQCCRATDSMSLATSSAA